MWTIEPSIHDGMTMTFFDVYPDFTTFKTDYNNIGFPTTTLTETNLQILYNLLYARYGTDNLSNVTLEQFKYRLFGTIFQYGPTWQARLNIQGKLRELLETGHETDLFKGTSAIYNSALNPEQTPKTGDLDELEYINSQNTTNYKKSKMNAYGELWDLLKVDVTEQFLARFKPLFKVFINPFGYGYVYKED